GYGIAEGATGIGVGYAVLSGKDHRYDDAPYVNQIVTSVNGGPASPHADGWLTYGLPCVSGLMYRDAVEIDELKMPIRFSHLRVRGGTGGAGQHRGGMSCDLAYGPTKHPMTVIFSQDTQTHAPKGVCGGEDGVRAGAWRLCANGEKVPLAANTQIVLQPGELVQGFDSSGGGYGKPKARNPKLVLDDVLEGWESLERARQIYGVAFTGS